MSNLLFTSKILEQVVAQHPEEHMEINDLWDSYQLAYRQNHSTETALLRSPIRHCQGSWQQILVIFLMIERSAAVDTLDHAILIKQFENSFDNTGQARVTSYLANRPRV